tara:strand:- start:195 stop:416 length:222 start_codon:yes stop_codon:yes gene_type:complete
MLIAFYFFLVAVAVGGILKLYDDYDSENKTGHGKYLYKAILFSLIFWGFYTIHDDLSKINKQLFNIYINTIKE